MPTSNNAHNLPSSLNTYEPETGIAMTARTADVGDPVVDRVDREVEAVLRGPAAGATSLVVAVSGLAAGPSHGVGYRCFAVLWNAGWLFALPGACQRLTRLA